MMYKYTSYEVLQDQKAVEPTNTLICSRTKRRLYPEWSEIMFLVINNSIQTLNSLIPRLQCSLHTVSVISGRGIYRCATVICSTIQVVCGRFKAAANNYFRH